MLELRWPSQDDIDALVDLAVDGVHDPAYMPFAHPWTDAPADELPWRSVQYYWGVWGSWTPERWRLDLVTVRDGVVVGTQGVAGEQFAIRREGHTGSWVGCRYQRQGIGAEMRAAVLQLLFEGLAAQWAISDAFEDNAASLGVSRKLGYSGDGIDIRERRGKPVTGIRFRLAREDWRRRDDITIHGLDGCLPMFGLGSSPTGGTAPADG